MRFIIKHEMKGRMRIHLLQNRMTYEQADILLYFLTNMKRFHQRKCMSARRMLSSAIPVTERPYIEEIKRFSYEKTEVPAGLLENSGRALNAAYQEKLINKVLFGYARKWFLPYPVMPLYDGSIVKVYLQRFKGVV